METKVALITGASRRLGAGILRALHNDGMNVVLHFRNSADEAKALCEELNGIRAGSAVMIQADLQNRESLDALAKQSCGYWGRLDLLVNNASSFYETPVGSVVDEQWEELLGSNLKAPFFLSQAVAPWLKKTGGCIVNIIDIHADRPLKGFSVYSIAKAGLAAMTRSLAIELAPEVRVNGIAPGAILWPEEGLAEEKKKEMLAAIPLAQKGSEEDIAEAVLFMARKGGYISGQVLAVDGGRMVCS